LKFDEPSIPSPLIHISKVSPGSLMAGRVRRGLSRMKEVAALVSLLIGGPTDDEHVGRAMMKGAGTRRAAAIKMKKHGFFNLSP